MTENFRFSGAPVTRILIQDRRLGLGNLIDLGMFMEGVAVAARGLGLDTCPQAAFAPGYADMSVPADRLHTEGEPISGLARFHSDTTPNEEDH